MPELNPDDWDGVYYDSGTGSFVTIDFDDPAAETITLSYYGEDASEDIHREEFIDSKTDFYPIPEHALDDPVDVVEDALADALDDTDGPAALALQFAIENTEVVATTPRQTSTDAGEKI